MRVLELVLEFDLDFHFDAALHSNLAPLGNISLPAPSLSLLGSPFATDTSAPASISIASAGP